MAGQNASGTADAIGKIIGDTGQGPGATGAGAPTSAPQGTGLEGYVATANQNQRNAIEGMGPNPYFKAAEGMSPGAYAVSPRNTATFSAPAGQGVAPAQVANAFAPPPPAQQSTMRRAV